MHLEYRFTAPPAPTAPDRAWRNSGVMFHTQAPKTTGLAQDVPISLEFQFLGGRGDNRPRPTGSLCTPGTHAEIDGRLEVTHCIGASAPTFSGDRRVEAGLAVFGDERIVHCIGEQPVIEHTAPVYGGGVVSGHDPASKPDGQPLTGGYIALQSEGRPIRFRRVEFPDLGGEAAQYSSEDSASKLCAALASESAASSRSTK